MAPYMTSGSTTDASGTGTRWIPYDYPNNFSSHTTEPSFYEEAKRRVSVLAKQLKNVRKEEKGGRIDLCSRHLWN